MPRPSKDDDATQNLHPEDDTQRAKQGTKIGKLRKERVLADFKRIARAKKRWKLSGGESDRFPGPYGGWNSNVPAAEWSRRKRQERQMNHFSGMWLTFPSVSTNRFVSA